MRGAWLIVLLLWSCGEPRGRDDRVSGESHWLDVCVADEDCGALSCICGVCTQGCDSDEACSALGGQCQVDACGVAVCLADPEADAAPDVSVADGAQPDARVTDEGALDVSPDAVAEADVRSPDAGADPDALVSDASPDLGDPVDLDRVVEVAVGGGYGCALHQDGLVVCWGLMFSPSSRFRSLSGGMDFICGVRLDDTLECWGGDGWGRRSHRRVDSPPSQPATGRRVGCVSMGPSRAGASHSEAHWCLRPGRTRADRRRLPRVRAGR